MVFKLCTRCGQPTPNRPAVCDACKEHEPERKREANRYYDRNRRDKKADAFYHSPDWRMSRTAYLQSIGYLCQDCVEELEAGERAEEDVQLATDVHHMVPISEDWSLRLAWSNFRGLCDLHHKQRRTPRR